MAEYSYTFQSLYPDVIISKGRQAVLIPIDLPEVIVTPYLEAQKAFSEARQMLLTAIHESGKG